MTGDEENNSADEGNPFIGRVREKNGKCYMFLNYLTETDYNGKSGIKDIPV